MKLGVKIDKPSIGRRFAIGDIHGCFNTFESLLEDILMLKREDQIFLLGDYIDRGPRNREVLDYIIELMEDGYQIFPLMGNHEYFVLRDLEFIEKTKVVSHIRDLIESKDLLDSNYNLGQRYVDFIKRLPYYYELDNFILVHAGLDFESEDPFSDKMSMIYARGYEVDRSMIDDKILIHGHTPTTLGEIRNQIKRRKDLGRINLDNGCVFKMYELKKRNDLGRLCALNLDTFELLYCEYID